VENELGHVPLDALEKRCSDEVTHPAIDAPKSHGKVFEIDNGNVVIWGYAKETLMEYKEYFCR
jgi:hypothetical protein